MDGIPDLAQILSCSENIPYKESYYGHGLRRYLPNMAILIICLVAHCLSARCMGISMSWCAIPKVQTFTFERKGSAYLVYLSSSWQMFICVNIGLYFFDATTDGGREKHIYNSHHVPPPLGAHSSFTRAYFPGWLQTPLGSRSK